MHTQAWHESTKTMRILIRQHTIQSPKFCLSATILSPVWEFVVDLTTAGKRRRLFVVPGIDCQFPHVVGRVDLGRHADQVDEVP